MTASKIYVCLFCQAYLLIYGTVCLSFLPSLMIQEGDTRSGWHFRATLNSCTIYPCLNGVLIWKCENGFHERAGRQKLVAQYIQKELLEADDLNLLDEEGFVLANMHLFGLNPLTDPLHLFSNHIRREILVKVCCNSCKKPVKASHFVVHTELCRSLGSAEEMHSELDGGTGNRKPPKRERKKLATARNQVTSTGPPERFADFDASQTAVSRCQLDELVGVTSCLGEAKETPGKISGLHVEMIPSTKRPKLVVSDVVQTLDAVRTEEGVNITTSFMEPLPYVPAPLATKTYYSQRNNRLQGTVTHMYHQAAREVCFNDNRDSQGNITTWEASAPRTLSSDDSSHSDKSSEVNVLKDGCQAADDSLNQVVLTDSYTSEAAALGARSTRYHSMSYSFTGKSGTVATH